jgi:hypothetical protein
MRIPKAMAMAIALLLAAGDAGATLVRGQVYVQFPQGAAPMGGAYVRICVAGYAQCMDYMTGYDGMYYFNVYAGTYVVYINGVQRFPAFYVPNQPYYDLMAVQGN